MHRDGPCDHYYVTMMFAHLGKRSALAGQNDAPADMTIAQTLGPEGTAIALAVARLDDLGHCATIAAIGKLAGMRTSTVGRHLRRRAAGNMIAQYNAIAHGCGDGSHLRAAHYRVA